MAEVSAPLCACVRACCGSTDLEACLKQGELHGVKKARLAGVVHEVGERAPTPTAMVYTMSDVRFLRCWTRFHLVAIMVSHSLTLQMRGGRGRSWVVLALFIPLRNA